MRIGRFGVVNTINVKDKDAGADTFRLILFLSATCLSHLYYQLLLIRRNSGNFDQWSILNIAHFFTSMSKDSSGAVYETVEIYLPKFDSEGAVPKGLLMNKRARREPQT